MIRLCLLVAAISCVVTAQPRPIVETSSGKLSGVRTFSGFSYTYFSFKGIPYAEPPVGELRFRNPVPHKGWSGVRDASYHGHNCATVGILGFMAGGHEDCLFLNVYSPNLSGNFSVMFWIHGGAFIFGDGNEFMYGPEFLLRENVVIVTMNYRLAALGFLSTGDKNAQGNYALKDIVTALKWVKQNIASFGGNPDKITVFGQSAGSVAVHLLLLSKMSKGLFQQAIMQSGTAFAPFAIQPNPRLKAEEIGRKLKIEFNSTETLMSELRKVDFKKIVDVERGMFSMDNPLGLRPFDFVPSIESEDSVEERFLTDDPLNIMLKGDYQNVPLIIGTNSNEGLVMARQPKIFPEIFNLYNKHDEFLVPISYNLTQNATEIAEVANTFRRDYFNGKNLSEESLGSWARYHTDAQFKFPTDRFIKLAARNSTEPIYSYEFGYVGGLNFVKNIQFLRGYEGACHADDLFYLFSTSVPIPIWPWDHAILVRRRFIRLFTNFAKFGNPTPKTDVLIDKLWPQYSQDKEEFFEIAHDFSVHQHQERLKSWHDFQQRFTGHI